MFRINTITRGRFGNKILHYNSLVQLAALYGRDVSCSPWEGHDYFQDLKHASTPKKDELFLSWQEILENPKLELSEDHEYELDTYCLHNGFWKLTHQDPRNFMQIKEVHKPVLSDDATNVGIHFRGTDILGADGNSGREIHSSQYYRDAIDFVVKELGDVMFYLCTDDLNFKSYQETVKYLQMKSLSFKKGNIHNYWADFATLSECEVLIASSSTFVVCAGFLGVEDKKIIHSMEWMQKNLDHTLWHPYKEDPPEVRKTQLSFDNFWVELYNGGNQYYHAWEFI